MYRKLLSVAARLPAAKRADQIQMIKLEFRRNHQEHDPARIDELLKRANSNLGYLRIVTPRRAAEQQGVTRIVFGDADPARPAKAVSNWTGRNMDPDSVKRHYNSLKRAGFSDNRSVKGALF